MFTLTLSYPDESRAKGAREVVKSSNIPQIGTGISGDRYYGTWVVAEVCQQIENGVLGSDVFVVLKEEEG